MRDREPCINGGGTHAWKSNGLDVDARGVLVSVRTCVWCQKAQSKPYGGPQRSWGVYREAPRTGFYMISELDELDDYNA